MRRHNKRKDSPSPYLPGLRWETPPKSDSHGESGEQHTANKSDLDSNRPDSKRISHDYPLEPPLIPSGTGSITSAPGQRSAEGNTQSNENHVTSEAPLESRGSELEYPLP